MGSIDLISKPLTQAERTSRFEALIEHPRYSTVQGRLELNARGQIIMTPPADVWHYRVSAPPSGSSPDGNDRAPQPGAPRADKRRAASRGPSRRLLPR